MKEAQRAYDMLRAYVGREWDRLNRIDEDRARDELDQAMEVRRSASNKPETRELTTNDLTPEQQKTLARTILGVGETDDYDAIRKAFVRLAKRSEATNFPAGSPEAEQAAEILRKVNWAYSTLTAEMDTTEKRFRSLEI